MTPRMRLCLLFALSGVIAGWALRQVTWQYGWSLMMLLTFVLSVGYILGGFFTWLHEREHAETLSDAIDEVTEELHLTTAERDQALAALASDRLGVRVTAHPPVLRSMS